MPLSLRGSCRCGAVRYTVESREPVPYQRCYCSVCRKTGGGGGYAINLGADARTLLVEDPGDRLGTFHAEIRDEDGACHRSTAERRFCTGCGSALWLFSPEWPDLVHPFASSVDTDLPVPPSRVHMMLRFRASWAEPEVAEGDATFEVGPEQSLEEWHKANGVWQS